MITPRPRSQYQSPPLKALDHHQSRRATAALNVSVRTRSRSLAAMRSPQYPQALSLSQVLREGPTRLDAPPPSLTDLEEVQGQHQQQVMAVTFYQQNRITTSVSASPRGACKSVRTSAQSPPGKDQLVASTNLLDILSAPSPAAASKAEPCEAPRLTTPSTGP